MDELGRHKMFDDGFSTQLARGDNKFKTLEAPRASLPLLVGSPARLRQVTVNQTWTRVWEGHQNSRHAWPRRAAAASAPPRTLPHATLPSRAQHRRTPPLPKASAPTGRLTAHSSVNTHV